MSGTRSHASAAANLAAAFLFLLPLSVVPQEVPRKAQGCAACHGPSGNSTDPAMPSLSGHPAQFIATSLYMFREGIRKDPLMSPMASTLSNADLNELAEYFSRQKAASPAHKTSPENAVAGPRLTEQHHCIQCHGPRLMGLQHIPRLAGQQYRYLKKQLHGFKAKTRADWDGNMAAAVQALSEHELDILADYLSGLNPP